MLWAPLAVADVDGSVAFYRDRLDLPLIERWHRPGDAGAVFDAGGGRIEVAAERWPARPVSIALELADRAAVRALVPAQVFPRGHFGGYLTDPDGHQILLFTEAT